MARKDRRITPEAGKKPTVAISRQRTTGKNSGVRCPQRTACLTMTMKNSSKIVRKLRKKGAELRAASGLLAFICQFSKIKLKVKCGSKPFCLTDVMDATIKYDHLLLQLQVLTIFLYFVSGLWLP